MNAESTVRGSLAGTLVRNSSLTKDMLMVGSGAAVTALAAQVSIPWQPVPFSLQTLAVALCGLALGAKRGALSQVAYLAAGCAGAPVFAEGKFGPQWLFGPTGGFLLAFVFVAGLLGFAADKGWDRKPLRLAVAMVAANLVLFGLGAGWLSVLVGPAKAFQAGVLPFVGSEAIKDVIAVLALPSAWWLVGKGRA